MLGIVRTIVIPPPGVYSELEEQVRDSYELNDVIVVGSSASEQGQLNALGIAGAAYLETTLTGSDRVGISSWSSTLLATVDAMTPRTIRTAEVIVQVLGGVGETSVQVKATHLTDRLARVTGADALFFPVPGVVSNSAVRDALLEDPYIRQAVEQWPSLTVVLVGIGSLEPSDLLRNSGNAINDEEQDRLRDRGAVGDICLRFFNAEGELVDIELHERVLGISSDDLRLIPRKVAIAGGTRKQEAIRAALLGKWVDVLITDTNAAEYLLRTKPPTSKVQKTCADQVKD